MYIHNSVLMSIIKTGDNDVMVFVKICRMKFKFTMFLKVSNVILYAFSKRKLCNGENFRIKDFDEFRCF